MSSWGLGPRGHAVVLPRQQRIVWLAHLLVSSLALSRWGCLLSCSSGCRAQPPQLGDNNSRLFDGSSTGPLGSKGATRIAEWLFGSMLAETPSIMIPVNIETVSIDSQSLRPSANTQQSNEAGWATFVIASKPKEAFDNSR
eukprot:722220-Prorocentrum_minimum.AAC.1